MVGSLLLSGVLFFLTFTLTRTNLREREGELGLSNDLINETLNSVRASLILATIITVLVGLMLGIVSSERVVRPLAGAANAARAIADGRLDTRLEPTDDPDLNALTESFNDMVARLQDRVERDARFASDVSHELRSPLMTLAASVEVMVSRRDELPERGQAALDLLVADVARFSSLVEDLLEISRYDAGAVRIMRDQLRVGEFVEQAVRASTLARSPIHIDPRCATTTLSGDRRRLARVVCMVAAALRCMFARPKIQTLTCGSPSKMPAKASPTPILIGFSNVSRAVLAPASAAHPRVLGSGSHSCVSMCDCTVDACGQSRAVTVSRVRVSSSNWPARPRPYDSQRNFCRCSAGH